MTKISHSPERHTFQLENARKRAAESGKEVPEHWVENMTSARERDQANLADPAWAEYNLENDLRTTDWILDKVRADDVYAQNLYAAMCNNDFQRLEVYPILANQVWSCSWRHAGGIISDMRESGDYIDWYCSGIFDEGQNASGKVAESDVTEEIENDLQRLGWRVVTVTE
jgi:hypothetical protein